MNIAPQQSALCRAIQDWLASHNCHDIRPVIVEIDRETGPACPYKQTLHYKPDMQAVTHGDKKAGETYTEENVYCVGSLPKSYRGPKRSKFPKGSVCFPNGGFDYYVAAYIETVPEAFTKSHPFGSNFILDKWSVPGDEAIDHWERKPYARKPVTFHPVQL